MSDRTFEACPEMCQGYPVADSSQVHLFPVHLIKYLVGAFELSFLKDRPVESLDGLSTGTVRLQTRGGIEHLFSVTNVTWSTFNQLGKAFGFSELSNTCYTGELGRRPPSP